MSESLLDTSVVIASQGDRLPPTAAISVVTLGELHAGVILARTDAIASLRRQRLVRIRVAFDPIPIDEPIAERYGELLALARSRRRSEKATDLLIVATAAATGSTLYTLDARQAEFARLAGVAVA